MLKRRKRLLIAIKYFRFQNAEEGRHVFPGLTVMENLEMGAFLKKNREENQANLKKVFSRFPRLEERKNQDAATLSGGGTKNACHGMRSYVNTKTSSFR